VSVKELLQALREDEESSFVRRGHLAELLHCPERHLFEVVDDRIRSATSALNWTPEPMHSPPHVLYHGLRRRAHPVAFRRGLRPNKGRWVILSPSREMALRLGRRRDPDPVILEVHAQEAERKGIGFFQTQGLLALAEFIPHQFITGPPIPPKQESRQPGKTRPKEPADLPGSFYLDRDRIIQKERIPSRIKREQSRLRDRKKRAKGRRDLW
jgi:putative RNA 2'-phosphotransferase